MEQQLPLKQAFDNMAKLRDRALEASLHDVFHHLPKALQQASSVHVPFNALFYHDLGAMHPDPLLPSHNSKHPAYPGGRTIR